MSLEKKIKYNLIYVGMGEIYGASPHLSLKN